MSNIKILKKAKSLPVKFVTFSDGALNCEIPDAGVLEDYVEGLVVQIHIEDCTIDLFKIMLVKDCLDNLGCINVSLTLSYIPNARADRRFTLGSAHPLKVFCNTLNSLGFKHVYVDDPHSDVAPSLIDRVKISTQTQCFKHIKFALDRLTEDYILCAPDLGSTKKIFDTVQSLGYKDYLQAVKIRDVETGNIMKCEIQCDDLSGKDVVILDDICDAGGSFVHLAKKLKEKGAGNVILFVTHGIFSKGLKVLEKDIDFILCNNVICSYVTQHDIEKFNNRYL